MIIEPQPTGRRILNIVQAIEQVLIQQTVSHGAVVTLNIGVLLRFTRLNVFNLDAFLYGPRLSPPKWHDSR